MSGKLSAGSDGWVEGTAFGGTAWRLRVSKDTSKKTKYVLRLVFKHGAKSSGGTNSGSKVGDAVSPSSHVLPCVFDCFVAELAASRRQVRSRRDRRGGQRERRRRARGEDAGKLEVIGVVEHVCRR